MTLAVTDAMHSRRSTEDSDRLTGDTGLGAETERVWDDGALLTSGAAWAASLPGGR